MVEVLDLKEFVFGWLFVKEWWIPLDFRLFWLLSLIRSVNYSSEISWDGFLMRGFGEKLLDWGKGDAILDFILEDLY